MTKTAGEMRRHVLGCETLGCGGSRVVGREGVVCVDELVRLRGEGGEGAGGGGTVGVLRAVGINRTVGVLIGHGGMVDVVCGWKEERECLVVKNGFK